MSTAPNIYNNAYKYYIVDECLNLSLGEVELGFDCLGGLGGAGEGDFIDGHALVLESGEEGGEARPVRFGDKMGRKVIGLIVGGVGANVEDLNIFFSGQFFDGFQECAHLPRRRAGAGSAGEPPGVFGFNFFSRGQKGVDTS